MHILILVDYEWDPAKARANHAKHGIRFADAVTVLEDDFALTMRDLSSEDEERLVTVGADGLGRILGRRLCLARRKFAHYFGPAGYTTGG